MAAQLFTFKTLGMLQATIIGNLGANAEIKSTDGREFVTFRIAHNDSFQRADGTKSEQSIWVDCTMSCANGRPAVLPYLTRGTAVCVVGNVSLRVYSSEKDRCMKAGLTIHVQKLELIGGTGDTIPRRLYTKDGVMVDVNKYYHCQTNESELLDQRGNRFSVLEGGWVTPAQAEQPQQEAEQEQPKKNSKNGK